MNQDELQDLEREYFINIAHARQDYQRLMMDLEKDYSDQLEQVRKDWYDVDMPAFIAEYVQVVRASPFYVPL